MILVLPLVALTRDAARDAAREELSRRQYTDAEPPLFQRLVGRATRWVGDRLDAAVGAVGGSGLGQVLLVALLAVVAVLVLVRLGPTAARGARPQVFDDGEVLTAQQHREQAEGFAGLGRFDEAVRERLRAVVRELEVRGVLDARAGRTAGEVARDGGTAVPALADGLRRGAHVFDEVWYGGRSAERPDYDVLVAVDDLVRGARTVGA